MSSNTPQDQPQDDDHKIIYPSPRHPTVLQVGRSRAWFLDIPTPSEEYGVFTPNWRAVVEAIGIHTFSMDSIHPYNVWVLRNGYQLYQLISNVDREAGKFLKEMDCNAARRILVCRAGSLPFGEYFFHMSVRPSRYIALLIMLFGHRNAAPCTHCAKRYANNLCEYTNNGEHLFGKRLFANVNWPFLYCISHPELAQGKCANCVYHVCPSCEYNQNSDAFENYKCISTRAATVHNSPMKPGPRLGEGDRFQLREAVDWRELRDEVEKPYQMQKYGGK